MLARAQRPISVTGLNDDEDEDDESENSEGAKRILARLGVAMARYTFPNLLFPCWIRAFHSRRPRIPDRNEHILI